MINPIKLQFVASYLYSFKKCNDHYISIGYAYAASTLALCFFIIITSILLLEGIGKGELIGKYIIFGNGLSFGVLYLTVLCLEYIYINSTASFSNLLNEYQELKYVKNNLGIIYVGPVLLLGLILLVVAVFTAPAV